ncbi:hypothetical protein D9V86_11275 [Bacteroidetes/Chlorobi group bacterium ChocPot_Mid]|nr:MAG: hypothetical protein D9V86_11275 [Bacteroidetes/Chlorobi group bacterium ChocPot_Mid]
MTPINLRTQQHFDNHLKKWSMNHQIFYLIKKNKIRKNLKIEVIKHFDKLIPMFIEAVNAM